jgi:primosomal protein N' (replication factor Y)
MFADIVFNRPIPPLTYAIPTDKMTVQPGTRVRVPLRNREVVGIVYRIKRRSDCSYAKAICAVLDAEPVISRDLIETAEWISRYYLCSIGEALWTIIPKGIKKREKEVTIERPHTGDGDFELTPDQRVVFDSLKRSLDRGRGEQFLLYGVTGSGKTEIYLRIIHEVIQRGRGAILLVPEISITPQTVQYFSRRVGDQLAILHSRLTKAEKINEWHRILNGERQIVIGARSAIFAPINDIGIIIIDEEHETSYKSDETPRYSAKSVAFFRARKHNASLILGSATPSVETFYHAKMKKMRLLQLPSRVLNQDLPKTYISDLRKVRGGTFISKSLITAIERRLRQEEQIILFLNRRGFSPHVYCTNCGHVFKCDNCDITLTFHKQDMKLCCHYCGYGEKPPEICPKCRSEAVAFSGFGTEKIERILNEQFPGAVIVRMDTDTVKKRTAISQILTAFSRKQIDILIGTQIVSKGLHFPNVTLVGVLNADIPLNFPDFRSSERTFNLITQVSGRAGRSEKGGEVIIQTYNPVHYAIQTAKNQNYEEFFAREIKFRQVLLYPPFCRIIRLVFRGTNPERLIENGTKVVGLIQERTSDFLSILGPVLCPISRIKNNYRAHIIIKLKETAQMRLLLGEVRDVLGKASDQYIEIDIDPVSML